MKRCLSYRGQKFMKWCIYYSYVSFTMFCSHHSNGTPPFFMQIYLSRGSRGNVSQSTLLISEFEVSWFEAGVGQAILVHSLWNTKLHLKGILLVGGGGGGGGGSVLGELSAQGWFSTVTPLSYMFCLLLDGCCCCGSAVLYWLVLTSSTKWRLPRIS